MHLATITTTIDGTTLDEPELVAALVEQRRIGLGGESGIDDAVTTLQAVGEVVEELLDDEPADEWRARAAADLHRLGITLPRRSPLVAVA